MRFKVFAALLCVALMAVAPASAYFIEGEEVPTSEDWNLYNPATNVQYASTGSSLLVIDADYTVGDAHQGSPGDMVYTTQAAGALNGSATAVFKMRTTEDTDFTYDAWERNIVLSFAKAGEPSYRKQVNLAVRPGGAAITNTNGNTVYTEIAGDNSDWVTWMIIGRNYGLNCDVYRNGQKVVDNFALNTTTDSAIGYIDALSITAIVAGGTTTSKDGTGSWEYDWVAYKAGEDANWNPNPVVPEPGSLVTLGSGLIGLAGFVIRRRK